jgi:hypothetical protein
MTSRIILKLFSDSVKALVSMSFFCSDFNLYILKIATPIKIRKIEETIIRISVRCSVDTKSGGIVNKVGIFCKLRQFL